MINRLPKQTEIAKFTFHFTTLQHGTTSSVTTRAAPNPNPSTLTFLNFLRLCHALPSRPAPGPANSETKQSVNHQTCFTIRRANTCTFSGASANAGPHYQKLYARVTHIWGNRKGQPDPSAMKGPRLERTASLITVPPASGKYENSWRGHRSNPNLLTSISLW